MRKIRVSSDPNSYSCFPTHQGSVVSTVCRIGADVQRYKFQFHATAGCVSAMQERRRQGCRRLVQPYEKLGGVGGCGTARSKVVGKKGEWKRGLI